MRLLGAVVVASIVGIVPRAFAHPRHGGGGAPEVRDHRGGSSGSSEPVVRDHRSHSEPVVRDHRSGSGATVRVRDHRNRSVEVEPVDVDDDDASLTTEPAGGAAPIVVHGPTWTLQVGGLFGSFRGPRMMRSGTLSANDTTYGYALSDGAPAAGDTGMAAGDLRMTVNAWSHFYLGGELQLGGVTRSPIQLMAASPDVHIASQAMLGIAGVAGARARAGIFELDGEVATGVRTLTTTIQTLDATDDDPSATEAVATPIVEGRLRAALWLAPHLFVSAQVAAGALDRSDLNFVFAIGTASRPYGVPR